MWEMGLPSGPASSQLYVWPTAHARFLCLSVRDCAGRAWGGRLSGGRSNCRDQDVIREDPGGRGGKLGEGGRVRYRTLCAPRDPGDVASWLGWCSARSHGACVLVEGAGGSQGWGRRARSGWDGLGQASPLGSGGRAWREVAMPSLGPRPCLRSVRSPALAVSFLLCDCPWPLASPVACQPSSHLRLLHGQLAPPRGPFAQDCTLQSMPFD